MGLGGICYLIVGINATKDISKADRFWIRLETLVDWKNIPKLMMANRNQGRKMVAIATTGYLYNGILKCAYWKCSILSFTTAGFI